MHRTGQFTPFPARQGSAIFGRPRVCIRKRLWADNSEQRIPTNRWATKCLSVDNSGLLAACSKLKRGSLLSGETHLDVDRDRHRQRRWLPANN